MMAVEELVPLSILQARVYFCIKRNGPIGPSKIGRMLKFDYEVASQNVTRPIRYLVRAGLVKRILINQRVVKYSATNDVDPPFEIFGATAEELSNANQ
jgi:DNA-binding MarR family transcriptional regulator